MIGSVAPEVQARWPLLSAWRWLVPTLGREVILSADTGGHSAAAVCAEGECDLAHRGVLPAALGRAILQAARGTPVPDDALPDAAEGFAHLLSSAQLAAEQARRRSLVDRLRPAIDFTAVLLCGLRAARWQYSARTGLVESCLRSMQACSAPQPGPAMAGIPPGVPSPLARYQAWSTSPGRVVTLRALRWLAPTSAIMCSACPLRWDVAFRSVPFSKSCGWPKPAGSRSAPACRLSGDTLSPGLLLLRSFIRCAPVLRFLALSLPLICVPRAGGRGWLRPRPSLSLAHGVTGLGMLCVVAATTVSTSGLTVVGTVVLMQRTCRPRLTSFSSALTVRSLGCLQLLPHLSVQLMLLCRKP